MPTATFVHCFDATLRDLLLDVLTAEGLEARRCDSLGELYGAALDGGCAIVDALGNPTGLSEVERTALRALDRRVGTIVLSGQTWSDQPSAETLGVDAILPKPFDVDDLLRAVAHAADRPDRARTGAGPVRDPSPG